MCSVPILAPFDGVPAKGVISGDGPNSRRAASASSSGFLPISITNVSGGSSLSTLQGTHPQKPACELIPCRAKTAAKDAATWSLLRPARFCSASPSIIDCPEEMQTPSGKSSSEMGLLNKSQCNKTHSPATCSAKFLGSDSLIYANTTRRGGGTDKSWLAAPVESNIWRGTKLAASFSRFVFSSSSCFSAACSLPISFASSFPTAVVCRCAR